MNLIPALQGLNGAPRGRVQQLWVRRGFPCQQQPGAAGTERGQRQGAARKKLPMVRKQRGSQPAQSLLLASKSPKNISEERHKLCELALCVKP